MTISYPIHLPSVAALPAGHILAAADLGLWDMRIVEDDDLDGILSKESVVSGTARPLKLKALDGNVWVVTVSDDGEYITTDSSGAAPRALLLVSVDTDLGWAVTVNSVGELQTHAVLGLGIFSSMRFKPRAVVGMSMSPFTFQQQVQEHQGQMWVVECKINKLLKHHAGVWKAALMSLNGRAGTFLLGDPTGVYPMGTPTGVPVVDGAGQEGRTLAIRGMTPNSEGNLLPDDWIQLGSGVNQHIYQVLKRVDADGDGKATLDIWPRLRSSPADGEELVVEWTSGVFRQESNETTWDISAPHIFDFEFTATEAF